MFAKKFSFRAGFFLAALAVVAAGCTPAGPRALLNGKKSLDRGEFIEAVAQLKIATDLLPTNAVAWNYYGVALQGAGHPDEAAQAYQAALKFDRNLSEVHYNLGCVALEQGHAEAARAEFTAFTLHRPNDAGGWLKLGGTQLKLGETTAAERSYSAVLSLKQNEAEAYNGLGLARVQRSLPRDAVKFFAAAAAAKPDYAAAILNLATVSQQYLHDNKTALENYRAYLALKPRPANWDEVNSISAGLEPAEVKVAAATPPVEKPAAPAVVPDTKSPPKISNVATQHPIAVIKTSAPPKIVVASAAPVRTAPAQVVEVKPETPVVTAPRVAVSTPAKPVVAAQPAAPPVEETAVAEEPPKKSFWGRLFGGSEKNDAAAGTKYMGSGLTPLPGNAEANAEPATKPAVVPAAKPLEVVQPVPVFARYTYLSPRKPAAGDRNAAMGAFTKARLFEQDEKSADALQWYQQAAALDASWFEAQYNAGVLAHRLRNFATALPRYEMALAAQPESVDARYNFALALKAAGFVPDAAEQLRKILAANPAEVRAHLALANICAQSLRDNAQARTHYLKVLELEPNNPSASDIRFWLSSNGK
jgi:tetratricopeptide (TPR) repeat protein